jgi:hypothetical protein
MFCYDRFGKTVMRPRIEAMYEYGEHKLVLPKKTAPESALKQQKKIN